MRLFSLLFLLASQSVRYEIMLNCCCRLGCFYKRVVTHILQRNSRSFSGVSKDFFRRTLSFFHAFINGSQIHFAIGARCKLPPKAINAAISSYAAIYQKMKIMPHKGKCQATYKVIKKLKLLRNGEFRSHSMTF